LNNANSGSTSIWVAQNDVVEIFEFDNLKSSLGLDRFQIMGGQHTRIPVICLLIDPQKQSYELMQIWVDRAIDSIRDLVHVLQHKLPDKWKQAYDGLFQVRGNRFTQLINIIRLVKYDVQPHEILVAKPWAMTAKVTIAFAGSAIRHLTRIGVISTENDIRDDKEQCRPRQSRNEDVPLLLNKRAQDRCYFPEGILNHHHAIQFITFSPPFESANNAIGIPSSNLSSSHNINPCSNCVEDGISSSLGPDSSYQRNSGLAHTGNVMASISSRHSSVVPYSLNSRTNHSFQNTSELSSEVKNKINKNRLVHSGSHSEIIITGTTQQKNKQRRRSGGGGGFFSKFYCFRRSTTGVPIAVMEKVESLGMNNNALRKSSHTSLSEEEEKRWLSSTMKSIDEDQSLASGSIVSMSAPLLSPTTTQLVSRHPRYNKKRIINNGHEL